MASMKLSSMKITPAERKEQTEAMPSKMDGPTYPYGLTVRLDEDAIDKLGMTTLPGVDGELMLVAKVKVVSVSSNEHSGDGSRGKHKHRSVELQITDLGLDDVPDEKSDTAAIYGKE